MKIKVNELKKGDVFKKTDDSKVFKVIEISEIPIYNFVKAEYAEDGKSVNMEAATVYPIMCDCFSPEHGKNLGYMKLSDGIEEVELLYREKEYEYV